MATNTGSNGGKNNTGEIRSSSPLNQNPGIASALNQVNYRREYNEKMFSDSGYLNSSIKDLEAQAKELDKILEKSKQLTQAEKNRYSKMSADMRKLAAEQNEMFTKQEASSKELQSTLNESSKLRLKAVDELYRQYMKKEKDLNDVGKRQVDSKIRQFAAASREIKADVEDINEATKNFENAKKSLSQGISESIEKYTKIASDLTKVLDIHAIAENEWTQKANQRYEMINKMNASLGYNVEAGTQAYTSMLGEFKNFNNNIDNLFSTDDMRNYIQEAMVNGARTEQLLENNLKQGMMANKYLGMTSETQSAMYRYMRLTNNNDAISTYNKTMIALQKEGIGVNRDMLNTMIQENVEVSDVLSAAGLSGETLKQFNNQRNILDAQISSKYGDEYGKQVNSMVNDAIKNLGSDQGRTQLVQSGINPWELQSALQSGNAERLYDMVVTGMGNMAGKYNGGVLGNMTYQQQLGLDAASINAANKIGANGIDELGPVTDEILDKVNNMSDDAAENYIAENTALDSLTKWANKNETWLEDTFGHGWSAMAKAAFIATIAGNAATLVKDIGGLFKEGGIVTKLFGKFFGKGSTLAGGAEQMSLFTHGGGTAGAGLGKLAAGLAVVGLTAAALKGIADANKGQQSEYYKEHYNENYNALNGSRYQGNTSVASASTSADAAKSRNWLFGWLGGMGNSFGSAFNMLGLIGTNNGKDKNKNLIDQINAERGFGDTNKNLAFAMLMDYGGSLDALNSVLGTNYTREGLQKYYWGQLLDDEAKLLYSNLRYWIEQKGEGGYTSNGKAILNSADVVSWLNDEYLQKVDNKVLENWEKNEYIKGDGYHLAGINRVPKDGYRAILHKDEMVLNKSEAEAYREMFGQITGRNGTGVGGYGVGDRPFNGPYVINAGWPTYSSGKHHGGIDLSFQANTPVGSAAPGTVARSEDLTNSDGSYRSYGRLIVIKGDNGADYYYAHLNERLVGVGQRVNAGDLIGKSGSTGNSTGPHLHFEVRNPREVDPSPFLTSSVWEIGNTAGASSQLGSTSSSDSSGSSNRIAAQLAAVNTSGHRAVPGLGGIGGKGGQSSTDRIVNSVDGVSSKIINYLDEIRQEQADQRRLINAFSASQTSVNDYR